MTEPQPAAGWTTPARLVRVIDGATVEVAVERRFVVRLLDCWAPEVRPRDRTENLAGLESRDNLVDLIGDEPLLLHVPAESPEFDERFSFGRVLGRLYTAAGELAALQVTAGHATTTKQKKAL